LGALRAHPLHQVSAPAPVPFKRYRALGKAANERQVLAFGAVMITGREPNIVACMAKAEQAKVLASEQRAIARRELDEQKQFAAILRKLKKQDKLHYVWPRGDKRSTIAIGHPDFSVWLPDGRTALLEFKLPGGKFSPEQAETMQLLQSLRHPVWTVSSADQAEGIVMALLNTTL
jgi:hypothetical protein